ncbi:hypothetical protein Cme02nite_24510 [Catellatospora methionotrophica]|uniref:Uncharacterized protein n=1 Tax=Catellatospora methionotrophica TaxID=121620 RepID=A0A8J3PEY4_9ACTN|nr:hypothetical protein [Catellatospora methionotrophica]GIG14119.1 hypothetical protein Cme02nite_24510 [Catellatospora methionotrophica]
MSYAIRRRAAAFAAAGLLAGLPLLGAGQAMAAEPEAAPGVSFDGGGLGLLLCGSKPATAKITVPAESKVRLTNGLGQGATLQIDGKDSAAVADGETVEVQFHRGPVKVAMVPECLLNLNPTFEPLTVDVVNRSTSTPPSSGNSGGGQGSGSTPSKKPSAKPSPTKGASQSSGGNRQTSPAGSPDNTDETVDVPDPSGAPLFEEPPVAGADGEPAPEESPNGSVVGSSNKIETRDAKLVSSDKGPIGLLAIIATVCVVGVAAGAIRAIIAQRATRAEFA